MQLILRELHKSCQNEDGTLDQRKGTQLLEVYSIEIQMYTAQKNTKSSKTCTSRRYKSPRPFPIRASRASFESAEERCT